jgi:VID27 PH-like domain
MAVSNLVYILFTVDATDIDLRPPQKKMSKDKSSPKRKAPQKTKAAGEADISNAMKSLSVGAPEQPQTSAPSTSRSSPQTAKSPVDDFPLLASEEAELHYWEREKGYFIKQADGVAKIVKRPTKGFEYWLIAGAEEGQLLAHKVTSDMNQRWSTKMSSLTWNHLGERGSQSSWCFRFLSENAFANFQHAFTRALWETLHQMSWDKSKVKAVVCHVLHIYLIN